jgi:D-glycero-D-manno-heptose 1,7-bisphosphate phosphatase
MLDLQLVNKEWTLFLDRDGVLNHDKEGSYIFSPDEFRFYEGVPAAMKICNRVFGTIVLVTNQRGVGKGLMTEKSLLDIHDKMLADLATTDGRIDAIYYATSLDNSHPDRKPQPGMAIKAKTAFPAIDFSRSIMVGNNLSDMEFARNAGMYAVFLQTTQPAIAPPHPLIDLAFKSLLKFAEALSVK